MTIPTFHILLLALMALAVLPSHGLGIVSDCFTIIPKRDLAYAFDAGQTPAKHLHHCATLTKQARKMGAVFRVDTKTCYFKNFVSNGARIYAPRESNVLFASYDVPGYDIHGASSYSEAIEHDCDLIVENGGRFWCKRFDGCAACTLLMTLPHCL